MSTKEGTRAILALEDGTFFEGKGFGRSAETFGEVVFNTTLCGYQEVLTDPSYRGQVVVMTYPHIGNYGVNREDVESLHPQVAGFVVREISTRASSWRASGELHRYLDEAGVVGISEIDTRALTRHIRTRGAMRGVISTTTLDADVLIRRAREAPSMVGLGGPGRPRDGRAVPRGGVRLRDEAKYPSHARRLGLRRDHRAGDDHRRGRDGRRSRRNLLFERPG